MLSDGVFFVGLKVISILAEFCIPEIVVLWLAVFS